MLNLEKEYIDSYEKAEEEIKENKRNQALLNRLKESKDEFTQEISLNERKLEYFNQRNLEVRGLLDY